MIREELSRQDGRSVKLAEEIRRRDYKLKIAGVLLACLIALQAGIFLLSVIPVKVVTFHSLTVVAIDVNESRPMITLELVYEKHKPIPGEYIVQLVNHHNLTYPAIQSNVEITKDKKAMLMTFDLPIPVPQGKYVAIFTARYQPNAFRVEAFTVKSAPFVMTK